MPVTDFLEKNAREHGGEVGLIEINPEVIDKDNLSWKEYALVETAHVHGYRKEMTWREFDGNANRFANLLIERGVKRGDKVAILLMNCIEWLPAYFGTLKSGATVVPLNYRYTSDEIKYCLELAGVSVLLFGPEFSGRLEAVKDVLPDMRRCFFLGENAPDFAGTYGAAMDSVPDSPAGITLRDADDAAIYFSSGTTGFPKAILHSHASLVSACVTERMHHGQTRDDVFLCIPPLYHTGAKM
ncbi:MAG: acyl--CoA ligase, partial [Synergistaceae bacterium]|nr:acyl--CoA ligase [Synergistaceae bacterium]